MSGDVGLQDLTLFTALFNPSYQSPTEASSHQGHITSMPLSCMHLYSFV